jgi:hypothetical protein
MAKPEALRILLSMRNFWYVRIFESVVRALASRGHHIHILVGHDPDPTGQWTSAADALVAASPNITMAFAERSIDDRWLDLRLMLRLGSDYARFLQPQYDAAPILAERARDRVPGRIRRLAEYSGPGHAAVRAVLRRVLRLAERAVPLDPEVAAAVAAGRPDVVLVTPLVDIGSYQHDAVTAARRLGIPTAVCVGSWDHLSSKALIRDQPDELLVWNATQRHEAVTMHGVPPERITVTGAQCFDHWFDRQPTLAGDAFYRKVGLDPSRPFVLYVCSALFEGSPNEAEFVLKWIDAVRASGREELRTAGVLVRPHPKRSFEWDGIDLSSLTNAALWPQRGTAPLDAPSRSDYFDSLFHSAAVVGLNTTALIEAGIAGRAVHTILLPEFLDNQEGTLHFHYLLEGGLLRATRTLPEHVDQLAHSLLHADPTVQHNRPFLEAFVRPHGLDVSATDRFVATVERLATSHPAKLAEPAWAPAVRALLAPIAARTSGTFVESVGRRRRYRDKEAESASRMAALQAQRAVEKADIVGARQRRREDEARAREQLIARTHREKVAVKAQARAAKEQAKAQRLAQRRREQHRRAVRERLAAYYRRILGVSSTGR